MDPVKAGRAWEIIPKLMEEAEKQGRRFPRKGALVRPQKNPIEWRANVTQIKNPDGSAVSGIDVEQLSYGEIEGRRQCWDVFEFIKGVTPGFENAYIVEIAPQIGIRETRRVVGEYMVSESDILECASFSDSIGVNGWPVEAHVSGAVLLKFPKIPESRGFNQLPYRMIVPKGIDNLFVAGRCASMTHDGQSSARVSGPCFAMGQAAGHGRGHGAGRRRQAGRRRCAVVAAPAGGGRRVPGRRRERHRARPKGRCAAWIAIVHIVRLIGGTGETG